MYTLRYLVIHNEIQFLEFEMLMIVEWTGTTDKKLFRQYFSLIKINGTRFL